jgi:GAF domain-containing protein
MATSLFFERYALLKIANDQLNAAATIEDVLEVMRAHARSIAEADGVAVIRRVGDEVAYVGEDAISPLWSGQRFPMGQCISGLALLEARPIIIPDILADDRVPHNVYLSTFVRSMAVFPLGAPAPIAALGLYWSDVRPLGRDVAVLTDFLAQSANAAFEQIAIRAERAAPAGGASLAA